VQLTKDHSSNPAISRDGKWIAFTYRPDPKKSFALAMIPSLGGQVTRIADLPDTPNPYYKCWTPDGRALTFIDERKGVGNLWNQPVSGGPPKQLTNFKSEEIFNFAWSRDGRLVLSRGTEPHDVVMISNFRTQ